MDTTNVGTQFEEAVLALFKARGYNLERNKFPESQSGAEHQIDIYGTGVRKGKAFTLGVECKFKDYGMLVTKGEVAEFMQKCHDCRIAEGYFATNSDYNENALKVARFYNIDTMDGRILNRMFKQDGIKYYCRMSAPMIDTPAGRFGKQLVDIVEGLGFLNNLPGDTK